MKELQHALSLYNRGLFVIFTQVEMSEETHDVPLHFEILF